MNSGRLRPRSTRADERRASLTPELADGFRKGGNHAPAPRNPPRHLSHGWKKTFSQQQKHPFSGKVPPHKHMLVCLQNRNKRKSRVLPKKILPLRGHQAIYEDICGCHYRGKFLASSR